MALRLSAQHVYKLLLKLSFLYLGTGSPGVADHRSGFYAFQDCNNVGLALVDGPFECSFAVAATQGVSGRLRARQGLWHLSFAATSAFDATSTRHVSAKPQKVERVRGVHSLKNKSINKQSFASIHKMTLRGKSLAVSGVHVGCVLQQKAAYLCMTLCSRPRQGSVLTEKQIN